MDSYSVINQIQQDVFNKFKRSIIQKMKPDFTDIDLEKLVFVRKPNEVALVVYFDNVRIGYVDLDWGYNADSFTNEFKITFHPI